MNREIVLTDNGSLAPSATLGLRALAAQVSALAGRRVAPVSLLHSSGVDPEKLGGLPAEILEPFLEKRSHAGVFRFRILPAFFGPSPAIIEYLPERLAALKRRHPELDVKIAPHLAADESGEATLSAILADRVRAAPSGRVILVDHGSPAPAVTAVRDRLAARMSDTLGAPVIAASMERRPGAEYDFNEPLLTTALDEVATETKPVIVAPLFLFSGRHAGPGGDIARIIADACARHPDLRVTTTAPLGDAPELARLLSARI